MTYYIDIRFGFRQHYSSKLALITLADKIDESLQKVECVLGVFLNSSKAFDTINHSTNCICMEYVVQHQIGLQIISRVKNNSLQ